MRTPSAMLWGILCLAGAAFSGAPPALGAGPAFDCQFNDSSCLASWPQHCGTWTVAGGYLSTNGLAACNASVSYAADFTGTLDYTVVMRRFGGDTSANRVYVRGVPVPLVGDDQQWYSGYFFQYTREGKISVWRTQNGANTALRSWTSHPAVNTGDAWNTLRVVAEGGDLDYYVNGALVWSGTDFTFSTGRVGIGLYVTSDGVGDSLDVDSAVLYGEVHPSPESTPTPVPLSRVDSGDYDGDGTSDAAIFRGPSGLWSVRDLTRFYLGNSADAPVCADYDGDGTSDVAIFRGSSGLWSARDLTRFYLGSGSDTPVPGDYGGNGTVQAGIFRLSQGLWSIRNLTRIYFGSSGDAAVPFEAGGRKRAAVFRSSSGLWSIRDLTRFYFGGSADIPVAGNYNEAPSWEGAVFRAATGLWSVRDLTRFYFGGGGDVPVPAEYAGTGTDRAGIFRPSSGLWSVRDLTRFYFGSAGDLPVTR